MVVTADLTRRTKEANALISQAFDITLPEVMREADGLKAVELTDDLNLLIAWASGFDLPAPVSIRSGLKAVDKAVEKEDRVALSQLRRSAVSSAVQTAASHALGIKLWPNLPAKYGVLSKGTLHAPARGIPKERRRRTMHTG